MIMRKANIQVTVATIAALLGLGGISDDSMSPAFTIDTRENRAGGNSSFDWTWAVGVWSGVFVGDTGGYYCDQDGDGIPDWWEVRYSSSRSKTGLLSEADYDCDGVMNLYEFVAGTDPTNATSVFAAKIEMRDGEPVVTWEPNLNTNGEVRLYKIHGKETLSGEEDWAYPTNALHRFFKVTVEML